MKIDIDRFRGMAPKISPTLLQADMASIAENCYFDSGALKPLRRRVVASVPLRGGEVKTIYRHDTINGSYWLSFTGTIDVLPSPVLNDSHRRVYMSGPILAKPQLASESMLSQGSVNPINTKSLGVPRPLANYSNLGSPSGGNSAYPEQRYYCFTLVTEFGEEGPPSDLIGASDGSPLICFQGSSLAITYNYTADSGIPYGYDGVIKYWNIYRTNTGSYGTKLQFVAQVPAAQVNYTDTIASSQLKEVLGSQLWVGPPEDLNGIKQMECGALVGFTERRLCFSDPFYPHAWPIEYQIPVAQDVVGLGVFGRSVLVLTPKEPFMLVGDSPASLERQRVDSGLSCTSKRSIADVGVGIMYSSPEGIMLVGSGGSSLITREVIDRRYWQSLEPSGIDGYNYGGRYVGFYDNGVDQGGFMVDMDGNYSMLDFHATAGFYDANGGELYLVEGGNQAVIFDSGDNLTFRWKSKPFPTSRLVNFAAGRIRAEGWPVYFNLYVDGSSEPTATMEITSEDIFRLPGETLGSTFEIELLSSSTVKRITLDESVSELIRTQE